jgi:lysyl-tRNA synthetase class 2
MAPCIVGNLHGFLSSLTAAAFTGSPAQSETGELSLEIKDTPTLLAPRLHELPAVITDEHTLSRFPQLSLVLDHQKRDLQRLRSEMEHRMYDYFRRNGFTKVSTPIMSTSTGGAVARPFVTKARDFPQQSLSLRIAQELDLKKLIAAGLDRVYELGPVFRNEGTPCSFLRTSLIPRDRCYAQSRVYDLRVLPIIRNY